jgi:predicted metal-dependent hydrolase
MDLHAIPVRRMGFARPDPATFHPLYIGGNSALSYTHSAMGLYAEHMEPFLVKSVRRVMDRITDAPLRDSVDRFCRQEAQHYQHHTDFNRVILGHGYPGLAERVQRLKADFDGFLAERDDAFRIGFAEGFESYTTQSALHALKVGWYDNEFTLEPWGQLFKWHMVEEIEHRAVAHDLYQHLFGTGLASWPHRAAMCGVAQRHIHRFIGDVMNLMSAVDIPRHGPRCRITPKARFWMAVAPIGMRLRTMRPGYSPADLEVPAFVGHFGADFSRRADAVS